MQIQATRIAMGFVTDIKQGFRLNQKLQVWCEVKGDDKQHWGRALGLPELRDMEN